MRFTIYFEAAKSTGKVIVHLWDADGNVRDIPGESVDALNFRFNVDIDTSFRRDIKFKFHFPGEPDKWESDDYIRHVPLHDVSTLWSFEYSSRCLLHSPEGPKVSEIKFNFMTKSKFAGGKILAWNPGVEDIQGERESFSETSRDVNNCVSHFVVPVRPWMTQGFHFKLVDKQAEVYEPDSCIRVWRPSDGGEILYKSGEVNPYQRGAQMAEKCRATTSKGEPCGSWAITNGLCRIHQGKSTALQKQPKSEKEKAVPKRCGAKTKDGGTCKAWAMENGFCRRHGEKAVTPIAPSEPKKEKKRASEKPATPQEPSKPDKEKPKVEISPSPKEPLKAKGDKPKRCGVTTSQGTSCKLSAVTDGRCRMHQSKPTALQKQSKSEKENAVPKRCGAKTKDGGSCKAWAMENGFCRRHGEKAVSPLAPSEPKKEKKRAAEKPATLQEPFKPDKEKPKKCGVTTSQGTPCKLSVVANGRCRMHQSKPSVPKEPCEKEEIDRKISETETAKVEGLNALEDTIIDRVITIGKKMANRLKDFF